MDRKAGTSLSLPSKYGKAEFFRGDLGWASVKLAGARTANGEVNAPAPTVVGRRWAHRGPAQALFPPEKSTAHFPAEDD
jgi:hypothetical protein